MLYRGWLWVALGLIMVTQLGCKTGSRNRILRQPVVEEYNLPPSDTNVTEGPFYPDQKRTLPVQVREQEKALGMGGRSGVGAGPGGGGGGGGAAGAGGPSGLMGNGSPVR